MKLPPLLLAAMAASKHPNTSKKRNQIGRGGTGELQLCDFGNPDRTSAEQKCPISDRGRCPGASFNPPPPRAPASGSHNRRIENIQTTLTREGLGRAGRGDKGRRYVGNSVCLPTMTTAHNSYFTAEIFMGYNPARGSEGVGNFTGRIALGQEGSNLTGRRRVTQTRSDLTR